jgi:hypothetical protein
MARPPRMLPQRCGQIGVGGNTDGGRTTDLSDRGDSGGWHRQGGRAGGAARPRPARGAKRRRVRLRLRIVSVGLRILSRDRPDDGPGRIGAAGSFRRHLFRRRRLARRARSRQLVGIAPRHLPGIRPIRLRPAGAAAARRAEPAPQRHAGDGRLGRRPRKQRRGIRRPRRPGARRTRSPSRARSSPPKGASGSFATPSISPARASGAR